MCSVLENMWTDPCFAQCIIIQPVRACWTSTCWVRVLSCGTASCTSCVCWPVTTDVQLQERWPHPLLMSRQPKAKWKMYSVQTTLTQCSQLTFRWWVLFLSVCVCVCVCGFPLASPYMCAHTSACMCMHLYTCMDIYVHEHRYAETQTDRGARTHTHTWHLTV